MAKHIHKCSMCQRYTLEMSCTVCRQPTVVPRPPKFSLDDKYELFRRETKKEQLRVKGWY